jgi:hypothetical protein
VPDLHLGPNRSTGLVDVLDRILEKGLVVAGDIKISLAEVELLTIRIRLIVCSIDKAQAIGLDWWRHDPYFSSHSDRGTLTAGAGKPPARRRTGSRSGRSGVPSAVRRRRRGGE